jgi:hypothetical protein
MKPNFIELIPFYGHFRYTKRLLINYDFNNKTNKIPLWFSLYHIVTGAIISYQILNLIIKLF